MTYRPRRGGCGAACSTHLARLFGIRVAGAEHFSRDCFIAGHRADARALIYERRARHAQLRFEAAAVPVFCCIKLLLLCSTCVCVCAVCARRMGECRTTHKKKKQRRKNNKMEDEAAVYDYGLFTLSLCSGLCICRIYIPRGRLYGRGFIS